MRWGPQSLVLVPEILRVLLHLHQTVPDSTRSLSFVAVGGGKVPAPLMEMATHTGLPVFEGYGLSDVIFGDGLKGNVALVDAFEGQQDLAREQLMGVCAHLPDYAQFHRLLFTSEISSPEMITANGRPKRSAIWQSLKENILTCSEEEDA